MYVNFKEKKMPVVYANTFLKRLIGMSFKRARQEYIYCFPRCNSIHTFFMLQKIDVVMTDKNHTILYMYQNVKPNHIILPKKNVYYTYEFSHNDELYNFLKENQIVILHN